MTDLLKYIDRLAEMASREAVKAEDAMRLTQAANNIANTMNVLARLPKPAAPE